MSKLCSFCLCDYVYASESSVINVFRNFPKRLKALKAFRLTKMGHCEVPLWGGQLVLLSQHPCQAVEGK
jgi:hypothetical protein